MNNIIELLNNEERKLIRYQSFKKGEIIFLEGQECQYLGVIINGTIKIASVTFNGKEIVYNTLSNDDLFGNNLLFSSSHFYKGDVISSTDSKIAFIHKNDLIYLLQNNLNFLQLYLKKQSDFGKQLNAKIKLLSFTNAEERFLFFLSMNNNKLEFESITSLAIELSLSREVLSRLISRLVKDEIIKRQKKTIFLL